MWHLISDFIQCLDLDILLSNKLWPFQLALSANGKLYQYQPNSDFSIFLKHFPVLLIEVSSNKGYADKCCMLLQAACLVHPGNTTLSLMWKGNSSLHNLFACVACLTLAINRLSCVTNSKSFICSIIWHTSSTSSPSSSDWMRGGSKCSNFLKWSWKGV